MIKWAPSVLARAERAFDLPKFVGICGPITGITATLVATEIPGIPYTVVGSAVGLSLLGLGLFYLVLQPQHFRAYATAFILFASLHAMLVAWWLYFATSQEQTPQGRPPAGAIASTSVAVDSDTPPEVATKFFYLSDDPAHLYYLLEPEQIEAGDHVVQISTWTEAVTIDRARGYVRADYGTFNVWPDGTLAYRNRSPSSVSTVDSLTITIANKNQISSTILVSVVTDPHELRGDDEVRGSNGDDLIYGMEGDDILHGRAGWDTMEGGLGSDVLFGGEGNDKLFGRHHDDTIWGGAGRDDIYGDGGDSAAYEGNDTLYGGTDRDYIFGGGGEDILYGEEGNDTLLGGAGDDILDGGPGADELVGQSGYDVLTGGSGADSFWFMNFTSDPDTVLDFSLFDGDTLELSNLLSNYTAPSIYNIRRFVKIERSGQGSEVYALEDERDMSSWSLIVTLKDTWLTLDQLILIDGIITVSPKGVRK
ncbi:hypothetical protein GCM10007989_05090 [Devosia pacifica]|uniref:Hemolysin type calcium-binding protein n=1 Tax=Devosia pacifica TaxID=1335967 RepID=A0A918VPG8_9HYPH|nr:calcium-binding protein [Devosia pacifica]GHA13471.1 hypothetical protein GCM10007989_05090 [Devosia pacifica]